MATIQASGTYADRTTATPNGGFSQEDEKVFAVTYTARGSVTAAVPVNNMSDFQREFGGRISVSPGYDCMEAYFLLGGAGGYVSRNALSSVQPASANLAGTSGVALVATAKNPGTWPNGSTIDIVNTGGTSYTVTVTPNAALLAEGFQVEQSYTLTTREEGKQWAAKYSKLITLESGGGTGLPVSVSASALSGGTDNTAVDATSLETALDRFDEQYGSGTVTLWGHTASALHRKALAHVDSISSFPRTAALDLADGDAATAEAAAQNLYQYAGRERAALCASYLVLPGGPLGAPREIPWSVVLAAHASRSDRTSVPGQALAGEANGAVTVQGLPIPGAKLKREYSLADRARLEEAGVTYARPQVVNGTIGVPVTAADRTISNYYDQSVPREYSDARLLMAIEARIRVKSSSAQFGSLGGDGKLVAQLTGDLTPLAADLFQAGVIGDGVMPYSQAYQVSVTPDRANGRVVITAAVYSAVSARVIQINIVHYVGA